MEMVWKVRLLFAISAFFSWPNFININGFRHDLLFNCFIFVLADFSHMHSHSRSCPCSRSHTRFFARLQKFHFIRLFRSVHENCIRFHSFVRFDDNCTNECINMHTSSRYTLNSIRLDSIQFNSIPMCCTDLIVWHVQDTCSTFGISNGKLVKLLLFVTLTVKYQSSTHRYLSLSLLFEWCGLKFPGNDTIFRKILHRNIIFGDFNGSHFDLIIHRKCKICQVYRLCIFSAYFS